MILVVGPGALGILFAARMAECGAAVALLDHDPARAARLAASGLTIEDPHGGAPRAVRVPVTASVAGLAPELVLLCVKVPATAAAVQAIAALPGRPTVLVLQNGLGRAAEVAGLLGDPGRVLGGSTREAATLLGEGRVLHAGRGPTRIAPLEWPRLELARRAQDLLLRQGKLPVEVEPDLRRLEWEKVLVNAAINALTGVLRCKNGALLESPAAAELASAAAVEAAAAARALGVSGWTDEEAVGEWRRVARFTAGNTSSTLQDLSRGRKTEVHAINGAVARAAQELGLPAPVNATLARLIAALEELDGRPPAPGG